MRMWYIMICRQMIYILFKAQLYSAKLMLDKANGARYNNLACAFSMRKNKIQEVKINANF